MTNLNINIAIDEEIITDYRETLSDQYDIVANAIVQLENDPNDTDAIHSVFRALHTVKGNSNLCQLDILTKFCHAIEEIAVALRQSEIEYTPILGELILLSLDKTKEVSEDLFNNREVDLNLLNRVEEALLTVSKVRGLQLTNKAAQTISLIASNTIQSGGLDIYALNSITSTGNNEKLPPDTSIPKDKIKCLDYFKQISCLLELKLPYWQGRVERTLPLMLQLNKQLGNPEDVTQLTAAVYLHDIGFAFLDESFWNNQTKFNTAQLEQMQQHPVLAAKLLEIIPGWEDAKAIVLQHHERWDGTGYPNQLTGDKIRAGAQLMAVVDAFESMTHSRPDRQYKRSILRAMTEINNCSGSQFAPHITSLFNVVVRDTLTHRNDKS